MFFCIQVTDRNNFHKHDRVYSERQIELKVDSSLTNKHIDKIFDKKAKRLLVTQK